MYTIFQEIGTSTLLVQCDICNRYLPLTKNKSTIHYQRHQGSAICREIQDQNNAQPTTTRSQIQTGMSFINTFQELGPDQRHSPVTDSALSAVTPTPTSFSFNYTPHNTLLAADQDPYLPPSSPPSLSPTSDLESDELFTLRPGKHNNLPDNICTGQIIEWKAGSVWDTYAYQQHDDDTIGWAPIGYEGPGWIRLQSKACNIFLKSAIEMNC